jgi:S-adenosylmethionine hydrolase
VSGKIAGRVVAITESGNLVTDITAAPLSGAPTDERVAVRCGEHVTNGIFSPDHGQPDFTFLAVLSDKGQLQLEVVGDNASLMLGIGVGETVVVEWP